MLPGKRCVALTEQGADVVTREHMRHPEHPCTFLNPKTGQPYTAHRLCCLHRQILKKVRLPAMGFRNLQLRAKSTATAAGRSRCPKVPTYIFYFPLSSTIRPWVK